MRLGRRDSTTASISEARRDLPPASFNLAQLIDSFRKKELNLRDLVALSGKFYKHLISRQHINRILTNTNDE